jgi:hypothetical protein
MFESIEIRKVKNGFIVIVNTDESADEYIFETHRRVTKFVKEFIETKSAAPTE